VHGTAKRDAVIRAKGIEYWLLTIDYLWNSLRGFVMVTLREATQVHSSMIQS